MDINLNKETISLCAALAKANENDTIYLKSNTLYKEKIEISIANLTLVGDNSTISYNDCHSSLDPITNKNVGTTGSATVRVLESAHGFKAVGVTFVNSHNRALDAKNQAVAFKAECSDLVLDNCHFISTQDTLYLDFGTNNLVRNCYIEGDVDFIFGSADVLFDDCQIHAITHLVSYYTAPDTFKSRSYGFVFLNCVFTTKSEKTYLGRRWYPSGAPEEVLPKVSFLDCSFIGEITPQMLQMHENDPLDGILNVENCTLNGVSLNFCESDFHYKPFLQKFGK